MPIKKERDGLICRRHSNNINFFFFYYNGMQITCIWQVYIHRNADNMHWDITFIRDIHD